jgi:hypothetical protein
MNKLEKANELLAGGNFTYKTVLYEIVPDILDLDINELSDVELVGHNYMLYLNIKDLPLEHLIAGLKLSIPSNQY